jgi:hypothetical protein
LDAAPVLDVGQELAGHPDIAAHAGSGQGPLIEQVLLEGAKEDLARHQQPLRLGRHDTQVAQMLDHAEPRRMRRRRPDRSRGYVKLLSPRAMAPMKYAIEDLRGPHGRESNQPLYQVDRPRGMLWNGLSTP